MQVISPSPLPSFLQTKHTRTSITEHIDMTEDDGKMWVLLSEVEKSGPSEHDELISRNVRLHG